MNLHLHHERDDSGLPDSVGDRHALIVRCNDLAHAVRERDQRIAHLETEVRQLKRQLAQPKKKGTVCEPH